MHSRSAQPIGLAAEHELARLDDGFDHRRLEQFHLLRCRHDDIGRRVNGDLMMLGNFGRGNKAVEQRICPGVGRTVHRHYRDGSGSTRRGRHILRQQTAASLVQPPPRDLQQLASVHKDLQLTRTHRLCQFRSFAHGRARLGVFFVPFEESATCHNAAASAPAMLAWTSPSTAGKTRAFRSSFVASESGIAWHAGCSGSRSSHGCERQPIDELARPDPCDALVRASFVAWGRWVGWRRSSPTCTGCRRHRRRSLSRSRAAGMVGAVADGHAHRSFRRQGDVHAVVDASSIARGGSR